MPDFSSDGIADHFTKPISIIDAVGTALGTAIRFGNAFL